MAEVKPDVSSKPKGGRKQWDKDEWAAKAKVKDEEQVERAKDAEKAMAQGKRPRHGPKEDLPKPTKALEARSEDVGIEKNLGKTVLVQTTTTGKGPRGAGFYCDLCNRTLKDSLSYLDHLNSRFRKFFSPSYLSADKPFPPMRTAPHPDKWDPSIHRQSISLVPCPISPPASYRSPSFVRPLSHDPFSPFLQNSSPTQALTRPHEVDPGDPADPDADLAKLGQTTQVSRSTLSQVRERIRQLRESTASKVTAKNYDFQARLAEVRSAEQVERDRRKEERKRKRVERREEEELGRVGVVKRSKGEKGTDGVGGGEVERAQKENEDIATMMGFGGFGGGKKR